MSTPTEPRPDMDALLGAYVLDALEPDERARVEEYIERHPPARAEVDELRETAAVLASAPLTDTSAPPELWERIAEAVGDADGAHDDLAAGRARRRARARWITTGIAAVATAAAIVLAVVVVSLDKDLDEARQPGDQQMTAAFERAVEVDGARQAELSSDQGDARVVMLPDGTGYIVSEDLRPLDDASTYQLWAVMGEGDEQRVISAGVLGPDPDAAGFMIDGPVEAFAMTVEAAGGVAASANEPFAVGALA